jgi:hypothetical protein
LLQAVPREGDELRSVLGADSAVGAAAFPVHEAARLGRDDHASLI